MTSSVKAEFSGIRSCIWPIHRHEVRKLVPMLLMISLVVFVYDILRNMKDAVTITAAGAEVIPFIKVWALLPGAILFTLIFTSLSNRFSQERVFYMMISGFLVFFVFFACILYPARETLHADQAANALKEILPGGFKGLIEMCRYWSFTVFYVMSELWGSIVLSVLFWGFANEVTRVGEARRFYSVFCIGANTAAIFAGQVAGFLPKSETSELVAAASNWQGSLNVLTILIVACGLMTMGIFRWMNNNVLNHPSFDDLHKSKRELKAKGKLSMKESFSFLSNSKYLICIAILVVSYNLVLNLVEVIWKDQLRRQYPSTEDYFAYMSGLTSVIGIVSACTALFMARIIDRFGWTRTSLITPVLMLVTSAGFFSFMFFQDYVEGGTLAFIGATPLAIAVFFGAAQNCLSKAMKYSVFDSTKEMTFIPLNHETKLKGKAAIDGVGSRLGKSGGSLIHTVLLMTFGSLTASAPYVATILTLVIGLWIYATRSLGRQFNALVDGEKSPIIKEAPVNALI
jgi:ATP:ADP antiporter, AAA family